MLDFLRKRKRSWTIFLIVGVISFVFILYFGSSSLVEDPTLGPVAKVNGEAISAAELETLVSRALRSNRSRQRFDELNLRIALLQDLIQTHLLLQEARRIGLEVTDEELTKTIAQNQVFQTDGQFNKALYLRMLRTNLMTPGQFEKARKDELLIDKLLDITRDSVHVSEAEVKEQYQLEREKINLNFIRLARKDFVQKATVSAEELKSYYDQNQEELKEPLKVSVEYIANPHSQYSSKIEVSEKDTEEYYNLHRDKKFHQDYAIRLRQIFFRNPTRKDPKKKEAIRAKAEQVLGQAQAGKDFAKLAKENSDDFSASSGGDTGFLSRGDILPVLEEAAFALKKGEISTLLESPNGLHILKGVETREEKTKTLKEAKDEIIRTIKKERGTEQALQAAETDRAKALEGESLSAIAEKRGLSVKVTPFFREEEGLKDVGPVDAFYTTSFTLTPEEISPVVEGPKATYLIKLKDRKERHLPALEAIRGDVTKMVKEKKAMEMATEKAATLLAELKEKKDIQQLASQDDLRVEETGLFFRNLKQDIQTANVMSKFQGLEAFSTLRIPKIGILDGIPTGGLPLSAQQPIANEVYSGKDAVYILTFKEGQAADMKNFERQKDFLLEAALKARQESALVQFMEGLKSRARIEVETESLSSS